MAEFFRALPVGEALVKSLNEMLEKKQITPEEALKVIDEYDVSIKDELHALCSTASCKRLGEKKLPRSEAHGVLESYQILEDNHRLDASNVQLKIKDGKTILLGDTRFLFSKENKIKKRKRRRNA